MSRLALALLAPGLLACAAKGAPAPAAPKPPALDPALESLEFYVGSWSCKGTNYAADGKCLRDISRYGLGNEDLQVSDLNEPGGSGIPIHCAQ